MEEIRWKGWPVGLFQETEDSKNPKPAGLSLAVSPTCWQTRTEAEQAKGEGERNRKSEREREVDKNRSSTPKPSIYPLLDRKSPLFGTIYRYLRVQGGSWQDPTELPRVCSVRATIRTGSQVKRMDVSATNFSEVQKLGAHSRWTA